MTSVLVKLTATGHISTDTMIRAVVFALVVAVASAAYIVDPDRSHPYRDEFDRPIFTPSMKAAFDVRTKTARTDQNVPIVSALTYAAAPAVHAAAPFAPVPHPHFI